MTKRPFNAVLVAFLVFLAGILIFAWLWPWVRAAISDDRLLAAVVLVYLFALRFLGRRIAALLMNSSAKTE